MVGGGLGGFLFCFALILIPPLLLVAVAVLVASAEGASAGPQLRAGRRVFAVATGVAVGCLVVVSAAVLGVYIALFANAGLAGCLLVLVPAALLGLLVAYRMAKAVAARLNRYRCRVCQNRFRAPWPMELCPRCAEQRERAALSEFALRLRELSGGTRPGE